MASRWPGSDTDLRPWLLFDFLSLTKMDWIILAPFCSLVALLGLQMAVMSHQSLFIEADC